MPYDCDKLKNLILLLVLKSLYCTCTLGLNMHRIKAYMHSPIRACIATQWMAIY